MRRARPRRAWRPPILGAALVAVALARSATVTAEPGPSATVANAASDVAARLGDQEITIADVDRHCGEKCVRLAASVRARERATLEELVDEALLADIPAPAPSPVPVSEEDVTRYLAAHATDFGGPPERDRSAVRYFLERERRRALAASLLAAAKERGAATLYLDRPTEEGTAGGTVVARVGQRTIRRREVEERGALALYRLRGELARERLRVLDALLRERLWSAAARERGLTPDALRAQIAAQVAPVSDGDIARYVATELRAKDPQAAPHPERIRPYLEFRARRAAEDAFLNERRRAQGVTVLLVEPAPPRLALDAGPGGYRGATPTAVRVLLLTSYRGAASRETWAMLRALATRDDVALGVRPLIPQWDPAATAAAAAVRCGAAQGRFWEMQDAVAGAPVLPNAGAAAALAPALGLDEPALRECMASAATRAAIAADSAAAERLGIVEPPAVLVDGLMLGAAPSHGRVRAAIAEARATRLATATPAAALSAPSSSASASP